jgi:hypothetical protein
MFTDPSGNYPCGLDVYVSFCTFTYKVVLGGIEDDIDKKGPPTEKQAPAWVHNAQVTQDYPGNKYDQAKEAFKQIKETYDPNEYGRLQIIGLSAGADSALILALMLKDAGIDADDLILLGPTFSGYGGEYGDLGDLKTMIEILDALTNDGMNIWVIDDQALGGDEHEYYQPPEDSDGLYTYIDESESDGWDHVQTEEEYWGEENWGSGYVNNDPYIRYEVMGGVYEY